jgi:hypothetical protein
MMTPEEFNVLDSDDQVRMAMGQDTLIGHRSTGPKSMHLYCVDNFYVEIIFKTRRKIILDIHASNDDSIIEPYLKQIDLSPLFDQ